MPFSRDAADCLAPRPGTPFDRLEAMHEALRAVAGASRLAPVRGPGRILAAGTGFDGWLEDIAAEFPAALIVAVGADIRGDVAGPPAGSAVRADLAGDLPFLDGAFDYVCHRMIPFAVPRHDRARQIDGLVRVLAPGGWIEVVETEPMMVPLGQGTEHLRRQIWRLLEVDPEAAASGEPLVELLRKRGLTDLGERRFELPIGSWAGEVGTAMLSNFRAVMGVVAPALESRLGIPTLDTLALVARSTEEIERQDTVAPLWFVWGRRPVR